jgi:hypothetical protein
MRTMQLTDNRSRRSAALLTGLLAAYLLIPVAAQAHHSFAMYDRTTVRTLTGRLTRFIPGSNHAQLYFEVVGADGVVAMDNGKPVVWGVETGPASTLAKRGITGETLPVGSIVTVNVYPLRDGRNFGVLAQQHEFIVSCGKALPAGGCTRDTGHVFDGLSN